MSGSEKGGEKMSRYIDADALKEWLDEYLSVFKKYDKGTIKGFVDHAPSIDIVRCKECRYWIDNISEDSTDDECRWRSEEAPNADDFCSYGERAEQTAPTTEDCSMVEQTEPSTDCSWK